MSIDVVIVSAPDERDDAFRVRIAAFVVEQRIPRSEELDALDATATYAADTSTASRCRRVGSRSARVREDWADGGAARSIAATATARRILSASNARRRPAVPVAP